MKKYRIDYSCQQMRTAFIEAENEKDAKEKFENGDDIISDELNDESEYKVEDITEERDDNNE